MKKLFILFMLLTPFFLQAQFVKSYQLMPQQNLTLNCISKSQTGTYFIAGIVDTSIYVAEVDQMGNKIREKLIGVGNRAYNLQSMITDADGNIVIVGAIQIGLTNTKAFLMKISPALVILLHRTYEDITQRGSVVSFTDVKDLKNNGTLDAYYISGYTRNANNNTGSDVLLITVDRTSGSITNKFSGNRGEDGYDALVLFPHKKAGTFNIIATGRLSTAGTPTFRPWISSHNSTLGFTGLAAQYLQPTNSSARLYSNSLILENAFTNTPLLTYCWQGDLNSTGFGVNIGMGSYNANTLNPIWQREYTVTPSAAQEKLLNQVAADKLGYVAEGNWWDGSTSTTDGAIAGEMFLLRTDKAGMPLWSRRLDNVFVNQRSHNSGMLIDNYKGSDVIYAVGFRTASSGVTEGVLVQMPITGNMDTICAPKQFVTALTRDYSVKDKIDSLAISMKDTMSYFPIDCIVSQASVSCDSCFTVKLLSADFQLDGTIHVGNTTNFIVKASSFTNTQNSQWIVSDVDLSTNLDMSPIITGAPLGPWGVASPSTTFGGYPTAETGIGNGFFVQGHKYRFRHILSQTNNCGQLFTDTVTKVIYMCTSCKNNKGGFIIIDESNGSQSNTFSSATFSNEKINLSKAEIYPNPANNTITINTEKLEVLNPVLQITTSTGQTIYSLKLNDIKHTLNVASWASGSYSYNIFAKGKIIDSGKFIVQH